MCQSKRPTTLGKRGPHWAKEAYTGQKRPNSALAHLMNVSPKRVLHMMLNSAMSIFCKSSVCFAQVCVYVWCVQVFVFVFCMCVCVLARARASVCVYVMCACVLCVRACGVCLQVERQRQHTDLVEIILDAVFGVELDRLLDSSVCEFAERLLFALRV